MAADDLHRDDPIQVLWEDSAAMVVNKPSGLLTQGAAGVPSLETILRAQVASKSDANSPYLAFAHRIDRPVSGALLIAKNARAARRFGAQFQSRKIGKCYLAICSGLLESSRDTWIDWMRKLPARSLAEIVDESHPDAKRAVLHYQTLATGADKFGNPITIVRVQLETGRMHQIRLQFATHGHSLLGDDKYGSAIAFGPEVDDTRRRSISLHAWKLEFHHPKTGVRTGVTAPIPEHWLNTIPETLLSTALRTVDSSG